jgi:hypothetical protein
MMTGLLLASLTTLQKAGIWIGGIVGVGVLLVTTISVWLSVVNERKRTQPIVLAHQVGGRRFARDHGRFGAPTGSGQFAVDIRLSNDGEGTAFNVRFGVEFHGVRIPYKHHQSHHHAGSVYRVLGTGQRLPPGDGASWPLGVDALVLIGKRGNPDATSVFWARYENAQGKVWETRNPGDPSKQLGIKRIRARRLHEWVEQRRRLKATRAGAEAEQAARAALLEQEQSPDPT